MQCLLGPLHPLPMPTKPWSLIGMYFTSPFPMLNRYDYLWVVICQLTSIVHLIPVNTTTMASKLVWIYIKEVVCLHGIPELIVSDQDSKFMPKFWCEVHRTVGTKPMISTAFHPQMDGVTERANCSIGQILRIMVQPDQMDWREKLSTVEFH